MKHLLLFAAITCSACGSPAVGGSSSATPENGTVAVDGGSLYYETAGKGAPVILIHGGFGDRRMWDEQFLPLSQVFRVIRYDHRGFGKSSAPDKPYSPVADLGRLMDHLKIPRANLVGNSMGGTLALDFALTNPDRTGAVVVIASAAAGYPTPDADRDRVMAVFNTARERDTASAASMWLQNPMVAVATTHPGASPLVRRMVEENQRVLLMEHWPEEALKPPTFERLAEVKAQTLFIVGSKDISLVREGAAASAARMPHAKIETIAGADHLLQMEEPAIVNKKLVDYISTNGC
jgi:3-oxoadipate enol-lactonase